MQNLLADLTKALQTDHRLVSDGHLLKNKVVELALSLDPTLLKVLLESSSLRRHFFVDVKGVMVFDKLKFQRFVTNKQFLPDSYTAFKNKIGLTAKSEYLSEAKEVVLVWPYKDCVLEGGQTKEDDKRNEVFWNETLAPDQIDRLLAPKALKAFRRIGGSSKGKPKAVTAADSFLIRGNNLLVMHTLMAQYSNSIKLIYFDPPYNTENDSFRYNDTFKHSTWLTFMRNRLVAAKALLRSDGVLAISIDHNEAFHLKVLCDEVFGRENFVTAITVQNNPKGRVMGGKHFATSHEYLLFYSKNKVPLDLTVTKTKAELKKDYTEQDEDGFFRTLELRNTHREIGRKQRPKLYFPLYIDETDSSVSVEPTAAHQIKVLPNWEDGFEGAWTWGKIKCELEGELLVGRLVKRVWKVFRKGYATDESGSTVSKKLKTIWFRKDFHTDKGQKTLDALIGRGRFRAPKPVGYIKTIIDLVTQSHEHDIVLDCFGGSGTTAQAVFELNKDDEGNRQFILSEQLDYIETTTLDRIKAAQSETNAPSFIYCELAAANEALVDEITSAQTTSDLVTAWGRVQGHGFLSYQVQPSQVDLGNEDFLKLSLDDQKRMLIETLDKNMLYVPLSELEDRTYGIDAHTVALNKQFFALKPREQA